MMMEALAYSFVRSSRISTSHYQSTCSGWSHVSSLPYFGTNYLMCDFRQRLLGTTVSIGRGRYNSTPWTHGAQRIEVWRYSLDVHHTRFSNLEDMPSASSKGITARDQFLMSPTSSPISQRSSKRVTRCSTHIYTKCIPQYSWLATNLFPAKVQLLLSFSSTRWDGRHQRRQEGREQDQLDGIDVPLLRTLLKTQTCVF